MADISRFTKGLSDIDRAKMFDSFISKLIKDGNSDRIISDTVNCLLNYDSFSPKKGESYDGISIHPRWGVRGY